MGHRAELGISLVLRWALEQKLLGHKFSALHCTHRHNFLGFGKIGGWLAHVANGANFSLRIFQPKGHCAVLKVGLDRALFQGSKKVEPVAAALPSLGDRNIGARVCKKRGYDARHGE